MRVKIRARQWNLVPYQVIANLGSLDIERLEVRSSLAQETIENNRNGSFLAFAFNNNRYNSTETVLRLAITISVTICHSTDAPSRYLSTFMSLLHYHSRNFIVRINRDRIPGNHDFEVRKFVRYADHSVTLQRIYQLRKGASIIGVPVWLSSGYFL